MGENKNLQITFHRKKFCQTTCDYLCSKLDADTEEDKIIIDQLKGLTDKSITKLLAKDANELVKRLLQAIVVIDDLDTEDDTDYRSVQNESEPDTEHESEEDGNDATIIEKAKSPKKQGSAKQPKKFTSKNKTSQKDVPRKTSEVTICKFFKNGRCNKAKNECRFSHPKICHKFNQFGPKNGINKGCDDSCEFYHPNACRNSVKDRTCSYEMCRFYHLKGTKLISRQVQTKQNTQKPKLFKKQENYKPKFSKISNESKAKNIELKNKYQVLETEIEEVSEAEVKPNVVPVFQKADASMAVTLQEIMQRLESMDKWQKDHQSQSYTQGIQNHQNSSQLNWRQSTSKEMVSVTQEQKARWESQDRAISQSMEQ